MARLRKHRSSAPRPLSPRGPPIVRCDTDPSQTTELLQGQELPRKLHLFFTSQTLRALQPGLSCFAGVVAVENSMEGSKTICMGEQ